jgi:hypothetical protein
MDLEDPELPGGDFLISFNKDLIGKWTWRISRFPEAISLVKPISGNKNTTKP